MRKEPVHTCSVSTKHMPVQAGKYIDDTIINIIIIRIIIIIICKIQETQT